MSSLLLSIKTSSQKLTPVRFALGITPFPYKVAKGLDENMYRNIEFDSWNEKRYLERMKKNYLQVIYLSNSISFFNGFKFK